MQPSDLLPLQRFLSPLAEFLPPATPCRHAGITPPPQLSRCSPNGDHGYGFNAWDSLSRDVGRNVPTGAEPAEEQAGACLWAAQPCLSWTLPGRC